MAELPVKARGVRSCSSPTSTLPSRLSSGSSDGEEEVCWICLSHRGGLEDPLEAPCRCPRKVHPRCLARWQLQKAGCSEEACCRFCGLTLPDWKSRLMPQGLRPASPVMSIHFGGETYMVKVAPGPDGLAHFKHEVRRLLRLDDDQEFEISFECKPPGSAQKMELKGMGAYDAAVFCASITAAERLAGGGPKTVDDASSPTATSGTPPMHHNYPHSTSPTNPAPIHSILPPALVPAAAAGGQQQQLTTPAPLPSAATRLRQAVPLLQPWNSDPRAAMMSSTSSSPTTTRPRRTPPADTASPLAASSRAAGATPPATLVIPASNLQPGTASRTASGAPQAPGTPEPLASSSRRRSRASSGAGPLAPVGSLHAALQRGLISALRTAGCGDSAAQQHAEESSSGVASAARFDSVLPAQAETQRQRRTGSYGASVSSPRAAAAAGEQSGAPHLTSHTSSTHHQLMPLPTLPEAAPLPAADMNAAAASASPFASMMTQTAALCSWGVPASAAAAVNGNNNNTGGVAPMMGSSFAPTPCAPATGVASAMSAGLPGHNSLLLPTQSSGSRAVRSLTLVGHSSLRRASRDVADVPLATMSYPAGMR